MVCTPNMQTFFIIFLSEFSKRSLIALLFPAVTLRKPSIFSRHDRVQTRSLSCEHLFSLLNHSGSCSKVSGTKITGKNIFLKAAHCENVLCCSQILRILRVYVMPVKIQQINISDFPHGLFINQTKDLMSNDDWAWGKLLHVEAAQIFWIPNPASIALISRGWSMMSVEANVCVY